MSEFFTWDDANDRVSCMTVYARLEMGTVDAYHVNGDPRFLVRVWAEDIHPTPVAAMRAKVQQEREKLERLERLLRLHESHEAQEANP